MQLFNSVLRFANHYKTSKEMKAFMEGQDYKSKKAAQRDWELVSMLINIIEALVKFIVLINTTKTASLEIKKKELLKYKQEAESASKNIKGDFIEMNNAINNAIVLMKNKIPDDVLERLRDHEREIRKSLF